MRADSNEGTSSRLLFGVRVELNDAEHAAVNKHIDVIAFPGLSREQKMQVDPALMYCLIAQGLWYYAIEVVKFKSMRGPGVTDSDARRIAARALMKSLQWVPAPIVMYEIATLLDTVDDENALKMFELFLQARESKTFQPTKLQKTALGQMGWDEAAAVRDARTKLGL